MQKIKLFLGLLVGLGVILAASFNPVTAQSEDPPTLMDLIRAHDQLNDFELLVDASGLAVNLERDGPFTVFAPTDAALANLETQVANSNATLTEILLYHVVNGRYTAADVANRAALPTLMGDQFAIHVNGGEIILNDAVTITTLDDVAINGVIHIVDAVLVPPVNSLFIATQGSQVDTLDAVLAADGRFTTLLSLLADADLNVDLSNPAQSYTVFAPTDAAFEKLSEEQMNQLMTDFQTREAILAYHVIGDPLGINQIATDRFIPTLEGRPLIVTTDESVKVYINGVPLESFNIVAANGVIHVLDTVLMP
jgi:transforming growth factor-beta-induced protein